MRVYIIRIFFIKGDNMFKTFIINVLTKYVTDGGSRSQKIVWSEKCR